MRTWLASSQDHQNYVRRAPSDQNALDLFKGEWASALPGEALQAGETPLFEDGRLSRALDAIGGVEGKRVLELGPLEGGHSYMMDRAGAASLLAIEANSRAYMRCLVAKELLGMPSVRFQLGDFGPFLDEGTHRFDAAVAFGVLYHSPNPVRTLVNLTKAADRIAIWSHYYDEERLRPLYGRRFRYRPDRQEHEGVAADTYRQRYRWIPGPRSFYGGTERFSRWMTLEAWRVILSERGFSFDLLERDENHPNGPCFLAAAIKL